MDLPGKEKEFRVTFQRNYFILAIESNYTSFFEGKCDRWSNNSWRASVCTVMAAIKLRQTLTTHKLTGQWAAWSVIELRVACAQMSHNLRSRDQLFASKSWREKRRCRDGQDWHKEVLSLGEFKWCQFAFIRSNLQEKGHPTSDSYIEPSKCNRSQQHKDTKKGRKHSSSSPSHFQ